MGQEGGPIIMDYFTIKGGLSPVGQSGDGAYGKCIKASIHLML